MLKIHGFWGYRCMYISFIFVLTLFQLIIVILKNDLEYLGFFKLFDKKKSKSPRLGFLFYTIINYHLIITLPQVNPLPKAANTTKSPSLIFPLSNASVKAIITDAAVVLPYFIILLKT